MKDFFNILGPVLFLSIISFTIKKITAQDNTVVNSTSYRKIPDEDGGSLCRPAEILKEGSVLDVLKNPGKAPAALEIV